MGKRKLSRSESASRVDVAAFSCCGCEPPYEARDGVAKVIRHPPHNNDATINVMNNDEIAGLAYFSIIMT